MGGGCLLIPEGLLWESEVGLTLAPEDRTWSQRALS